MTDVSYRDITNNGLWKNNAALVQLLGLCPLLAVTASVVNALGLGLATMMVLIGSNISVSLMRKRISDAIKIPTFVMIIATFTTCTELLMKAFAFELYLILGIFIPLIVTNCAILGRAEAFACKNNVIASALDGFMMGAGFSLVLLVIGAIREILGSGTLFANMQLLFGPIAENWTLIIFSDSYSFLIAVLPPGAFLVTGMLIALKNTIDTSIQQRNATRREPVVKGEKRVRATSPVN